MFAMWTKSRRWLILVGVVGCASNPPPVATTTPASAPPAPSTPAAAPAAPPPAKLRAPEEILADAVKATGGAAAWNAHKTAHYKVETTLQGMGMGGTGERYQTRTDKSLMTMTMAGLGVVREGTNGQADNGTARNDELLGSHGNDTVRGGTGHDILWGDYLPTANNTWQHDVMDGGPGRDWIYSSHGHNDIWGGAGNDHIWGHYGYGTIDCGPGYDVVHTKRHSTYKLRHCERHLIH